tara:strand:- start:455 stop:937 length:483 start_codon:yes stop_codon:yes gene_type:complete
MYRYQEQNSEQTLQEGLDEFYSINSKFRELSETGEKKGLFFQHDITHIVFGLNTKLEEEHLLDSWALWGCKIKWKTMYEYMRHPAIKEITREIYKDLGTWGVVKKIITMIPLKLLIVSRALRMKKKWDYHNVTEGKLKSKISDIRKEYNINVYKIGKKLN